MVNVSESQPNSTNHLDANSQYQIWEKAEIEFVQTMMKAVESIESQLPIINEKQKADIRFCIIRCFKKSAQKSIDPGFKELLEIRLKKDLKKFDLTYERISTDALDINTLVRAWQRYNTQINPIIELLIPYVTKLSYRHYKYSSIDYQMHFDDIVSSGHIGLIMSIPNYNYLKSKFITFATPWIEGNIRKYISDIYKVDNKEEKKDPLIIIDKVEEGSQKINKPPDSEFINHENSEQLLRAVNKLSTNRRLVIQKRYVFEKQYKHIAKQLNKKEDAVRKLHQYSIEELKKAGLEDLFDDIKNI